MIVLKELIDKDKANKKVLSINDIQIHDNVEIYGGKKCRDISGGIRGGHEGVIMDEALKIILSISSIYLVNENDKRYLLRQNGVNYSVNKRQVGGGFAERVDYIDFSDITENQWPNKQGVRNE